MKIVGWIVGLILFAFSLVYVILFTSFGNALVKPYLEKEIQKYTQLDSRLKEFQFGFGSYDFTLELDKTNSLKIEGEYSLATKSIKANYVVKFDQIENLSHLIQKKLKGSLKAYGVAKGNIDNVTLYGSGALASSETRYHIEIKNKKITSLIASMKHADIQELLEFVQEKEYAKGNVDINLHLNSVEINNLDGDVKIYSANGEINTKLIQEMYNIEIPSAKLTIDIDSKIKNEIVNFDASIVSDLIKIISSGTLEQKTLESDIVYDIDTKEMALFKKLTKKTYRGPCNLKGVIKGNKEQMFIDGRSTFANSDTSLHLTLEQLKAVSLTGKMQHLDIKKFLYFLNEYPYGSGVANLDINMENIRKGQRKGSLVATIDNGTLYGKYFNEKKKFKSDMPDINLSMKSYSIFKDDLVKSNINLSSSVFDLYAKNFVYDSRKKHIESEYVIDVPDMDRIYFLTQQHLRTPFQAHGHYIKNENVDVSLQGKIAKGTIDATLFNDALNASLKSIDTLELLYILDYPQIFQALLNAELTYDKEKKSGSLKAAMRDGKFTQNKAFTLAQAYTKMDLYQERFQGRVNTNISNNVSNSSFVLKSDKSSISSKSMVLDHNRKLIDTTIDINANNNPVSIILTGDQSDPGIKIDVKELIKKEAKKDLDKKIDKFLKRFF